MNLVCRVAFLVFSVSIGSAYAHKNTYCTWEYLKPRALDLEQSVELIMAEADIDAYYQYVDFDNIALKESPSSLPGFVYLIPFQTSSTSDWNVCLAILDEHYEVVLYGVAMNTWKYHKEMNYYPVIEYEKSFIYNKTTDLNIAIDVLKTDEQNNTEIISHERLIFVPNKTRTKLNKILQYEYNTVIKRDDDRANSYAFSVNNNDKLVIEPASTGQFQNLSLSRERNTSISVVPVLKQKCATASKSGSPFLIKEQSEAPFLTAYFIQKYTEEYIYYEEEEKYKELSSSIPIANIMGLYEKCVIPSKK